jgi:hypothetical protein
MADGNRNSRPMRRWRNGPLAAAAALLLCLAGGRVPALAQAAPEAALGETAAAEAELLAELVRYAQGLSMQAMLGQIDRASADARLADMAGRLREHGATHDLRETILGVHHQAAVQLFDALERRIGEGARWPTDQPAAVYRALARITLLGARTLYDSLIGPRLDTRSALYDANLVYAWTIGRTEVTPDIDYFQRAPLDAEYHLGAVAIPVPQKPAGPLVAGDGDGGIIDLNGPGEGTDDGGLDLAGNLARGRPASQSSTSQWSRGADEAGGAVDGVINGGYGFHTDWEAEPWWQVDLGGFAPVGEVRVFNRLDCCGERALSLRILFSDDAEIWRTVYTHDGTPFGGADGKPLAVRLNAGTTRFVRLQLGATDYLHLDEVEIYAPTN